MSNKEHILQPDPQIAKDLESAFENREIQRKLLNCKFPKKNGSLKVNIENIYKEVSEKK